MATVRLDADQERALDELAKATGRSKSYYIKEALAIYLEDRADYLLGVAALEREEETYSSDEVRRRLGLAG